MWWTRPPVNPSEATVSSLGGRSSQQFTAIGTFEDGTDRDVTDSVLWFSSDPFVATVSSVDGSPGLAHGVKTGSTLIYALTTTTGTPNVGGLVAEGHVFEAHLAVHAVERHGSGSVHHIRLQVEHLEDPLEAHQGRRKLDAQVGHIEKRLPDMRSSGARHAKRRRFYREARRHVISLMP